MPKLAGKFARVRDAETIVDELIGVISTKDDSVGLSLHRVPRPMHCDFWLKSGVDSFLSILCGEIHVHYVARREDKAVDDGRFREEGNNTENSTEIKSMKICKGETCHIPKHACISLSCKMSGTEFLKLSIPPFLAKGFELRTYPEQVSGEAPCPVFMARSSKVSIGGKVAEEFIGPSSTETEDVKLLVYPYRTAEQNQTIKNDETIKNDFDTLNKHDDKKDGDGWITMTPHAGWTCVRRGTVRLRLLDSQGDCESGNEELIIHGGETFFSSSDEIIAGKMDDSNETELISLHVVALHPY